MDCRDAEMAAMTRHSTRCAGLHMGPGSPEPVTLPVAIRAWCRRDPRSPTGKPTAASKPRRWKPPPRPRKFIAFGSSIHFGADPYMRGCSAERWRGCPLSDLARRSQIGDTHQRAKYQSRASAALATPQAVLSRRLRRSRSHHRPQSSVRSRASRFGLARSEKRQERRRVETRPLDFPGS